MTDTLRITTAMTLAASAFALTSNIERIEITAPGFVSLTLNDTMVATRDSVAFVVSAARAATPCMAAGCRRRRW